MLTAVRRRLRGARKGEQTVEQLERDVEPPLENAGKLSLAQLVGTGDEREWRERVLQIVGDAARESVEIAIRLFELFFALRECEAIA